MFKAIKDHRIIAINNEEIKGGLVFDEMVEDTEHIVDDYVQVDGEYVLTTSTEATRQQKILRIEELKQLLINADYWGQKYIDGEYTEEEWAEKVSQRKSWREEIRRLESEI